MEEHLERARKAIEEATAHLSVERIGRQVPGAWSIALILEHLTLAFRLNVSALEKAIAEGRTKARRPTFTQWVSRVLVIDLGYFPRAQAPDNVKPSGSIPPEQVREAIAEALASLDVTLVRAAERFGDDTPLLRHAFFAALTVPQWRKFHLRHALHHMRQVRERAA